MRLLAAGQQVVAAGVRLPHLLIVHLQAATVGHEVLAVLLLLLLLGVRLRKQTQQQLHMRPGSSNSSRVGLPVSRCHLSCQILVTRCCAEQQQQQQARMAMGRSRCGVQLQLSSGCSSSSAALRHLRQQQQQQVALLLPLLLLRAVRGV
jgi:hypothetical protein